MSKGFTPVWLYAQTSWICQQRLETILTHPMKKKQKVVWYKHRHSVIILVYWKLFIYVIRSQNKVIFSFLKGIMFDKSVFEQYLWLGVSKHDDDWIDTWKHFADKPIFVHRRSFLLALTCLWLLYTKDHKIKNHKTPS